MPTYDYDCEKCDKPYSVIKSIKTYDGKDECPTCSNVGRRVFSCKVQFIGTKVEEAEFNVGLGAITKSKKHRDEIAKRKGAIEIGNEAPATVHNYFDKSRAEKRKLSWDKV
jgi:putative FmdB family regulatory protein